MKANVEISPSQTNQQFLQPSESADISHKINIQIQQINRNRVDSRFLSLPACVVKGIFNGLEPISTLQPSLDLSGLAGGGQPHHGSSSHAVTQDTTIGSASKLQRTADMITLK